MTTHSLDAITAPAPALQSRLRRRLLSRDAIIVAGWASIAFSVALWLADGGLSKVNSVANALTAAGIVTGLIGTDLVVLMLILAARIPVLDRTMGHDKAMALHRKLGKPALYLLLGHGLLLSTSYGMAEGINPISEAVSLWVQVPDMWLAFLSVALFILVVVTSLVAVRKRFPYEFWHAIHLLSYAAVATAIPHEFSVGAVFAEGTWQRWYWVFLYVATAVALLIFRVIIPIRASLRHQLTVVAVEPQGLDAVNVILGGQHLNELAGNGGRFFIWRFLTPGMFLQAHPYSLSAEPAANHLRITVRNLGAGSARLASLKPGTKVAVEGPYGMFGTAARTQERVVLIGAGIGITPLRALLESTPFPRGGATVLLRATDQSGLYLSDEILELARRRDARVFHLTGKRSHAPGKEWLPAEAANAGYGLSDYAPDLADSDVYICGPNRWAEAVIAEATAAGVSEDQIHFERFDW
ncbi:ferredoxin reductase family protein [Pseudarthrobacter sp. J1738]|uniref:ferredoxin reductase family protein n=1 Tax=unclassified Pseudarthrobacter TaxID=2647000 RepID=UPI003D2DF935